MENLKRFRWVGLPLTLFVLFAALGVHSSGPAWALEKKLKDQAVAAAAFIVASDEKGNAMGSGSGAVLTSDGLILTNFHVVGDVQTGKFYNSKGLLAVGLLKDPRLPPEVNYIAQVVAYDPNVDLAVIKLTSCLDGSRLPANMSLPFVPTGDAEKLSVGDAVTVIGFPEIGFTGSQNVVSLAYSEGSVAGFAADPQNPRLKVGWIKTDAATDSGDSGAMVVNEKGQIVGVHTQAWSDPGSTARLSAERPINAAYELVKQAKAGASSLKGGGYRPR